jgi:hypothetical protein
MKNLIALIISGALVVSGYSQTRNVLVGTNNAVVQPTNFWSGDASNARVGLGLGTAATNPASAFQPSSVILSNLAVGGGSSLTNIAASNIVGTLSIGQGGTGSTNASNARTALGLGTAATNPATAFQASSANLTNLAANNGGALTNLTATSIVGIIPSSNISTVNFSNLSGTLAIASGGTGATNAANARQNLGSTTVGDAVFIATNAAAARTAIGALASNSDGSGLTNLTAANITGTVALASNLSSPLSLTNGGTGATNAATARTNLGLGWSALTNSNAAASLLGVATNGNVVYSGTNPINFDNGYVFFDSDTSIGGSGGELRYGGQVRFDLETMTLETAFNYAGTAAADSRAALGLGWPALTNSNAGTGLVSVNTNGEVVSPTNFWQVAPITTTFLEFDPATNATTNIVAARNLHIHSLAISRTGVTSTIALPITNSFNGDIALVVHQGPTSSVTAVRTAGAGTNLITLNQFEEAVEFVYYDNVWQFNHNRSFIEPIFFSGTNAAANRAASRTNLGLGTTNSVEFAQVVVSKNDLTTALYSQGGIIFEADGTNYSSIFAFGGDESANLQARARTNLGLGATWLTNTDVTNFRTAIGLGTTNSVEFNSLKLSTLSNTNSEETVVIADENGTVSSIPFVTFQGSLGLGTNGSPNFASVGLRGNIVISNQSAATNGLLFIYRTNNEPFLGLANLIASNNVTVSNETLFRVGTAEATNKAAQFGFRSTNTNGNGVAVFSVFGYNALMMIGPSDPAAGTNPIEATVYSVNPTNKVMTLIKTNTGATMFHRAIEFENTTNQAITRTNLGIPLAALTNTSATNFQKAIFITNTAPTNIGGNLGTIAAWIEIVASNGVTYKVPAYTNVP